MMLISYKADWSSVLAFAEPEGESLERDLPMVLASEYRMLVADFGSPLASWAELSFALNLRLISTRTLGICKSGCCCCCCGGGEIAPNEDWLKEEERRESLFAFVRPLCAQTTPESLSSLE